MRVGMLWFDDSKERTLEQKVRRAARTYEEKYGMPPTICYVHSTAFNGSGMNSTAFGGIEVKSTNMVLPHHFWLGRTDPKE